MALIESTRIAVAGGQTAVMPSCDAGHSPIVFREEQEKAINQTLEYLQKGRKMLWDAKMRFGKHCAPLNMSDAAVSGVCSSSLTVQW